MTTGETEFISAFILIFASEMGDKSQVVSFGFGAKEKPIIVLPAIFIATALMLFGATALGHVAGLLLPYFWLNIIAAGLFFVFGCMSLSGQHEEAHKTVGTKFGAFAAIFLTFLISELGDKTIFATMTLSGHSRNFLPIWFGSTLGMFAADLLAIVMGIFVGHALPARATSIGSAVVFFLAGAWTLYDAVKGAGVL